MSKMVEAMANWAGWKRPMPGSRRLSICLLCASAAPNLKTATTRPMLTMYISTAPHFTHL